MTRGRTPPKFQMPQANQGESLPLNERITSVDLLRAWTDKIPLRYEYTAGVAGEKFLRGLRRGRILASACGRCKRRYLPPKTYCVECYALTTKMVEVGPEGRVEALTEARVDFEGRRTGTARRLAFVTFKGITGGLVHKVSGEGLRVGSRVRASFAPENKRTGSLLDIEGFVRA